MKHIAYKGFVKLLVIVPLDAAGNRKRQNKNKNIIGRIGKTGAERSVHELLVVLIAERPVWSVKS